MKLLERIKIGNLTLKNRMVMAAMTRSRAGIDGIIGDMAAEYYAQRASAGLILTEGINISQDAIGSPFTPGIYSQAQINAWKKVTTSVHDQGGVIFAQLWHTGRVGHSVDRNGVLPVAPSAIMVEAAQHFTSEGMKNFETPRQLNIEEIERTIQDYKQAALNAVGAGFDGVELHAANGYLPNQFIADSSNQRTDKYGGSIENNSRFILEVMKALIEAVGAKRVSIKISPLHSYAGVVLEDPIASYSYLIGELNKLDFAFLEIMKRSPMFPFVPHYPDVDEIALFGGLSKNTVVANTGYTRESGEAELNNGIAQLISYGVLFLANPDLPGRFKQNADLNKPDLNTMFGGTQVGYTDYPFLEK